MLTAAFASQGRWNGWLQNEVTKAHTSSPLSTCSNTNMTSVRCGEKRRHAGGLSGSEMDSIIQALGGNDEIYASLGNNFVFGGAGDDAWVVYEGNTPQYEVLK
jgi:Ca2+-binding RTX toxin-like protein